MAGTRVADDASQSFSRNSPQRYSWIVARIVSQATIVILSCGGIVWLSIIANANPKNDAFG